MPTTRTFSSPDHAVVAFEGPDAANFLQSQLTHDVKRLAVGDWQWQGYCSAKGRLVATFALARTGESAFAAVVHASLADTLVKRLTMFRLRSKLSIERRSDCMLAYCLAENADASTAPPLHALVCMALQPTLLCAICPSQAAPPIATDEDRRLLALARIRARQPEITAASSERFVPQMIDWDQVTPGGGVSFSKGCYPGQEVVARAHYRGAVKKRLEQVRLPAEGRFAIGQPLVLPDGRDADLCDLAQDGDGYLALVVAQPAGAA